MIVSRYNSPKDPWPKERDLSLDEVVQVLTTPLPDDGRPKDAYPLWSPARYPHYTNDRGEDVTVRRSKAAALEVALLVADVDDGTPINEALDRLRRVTDALVIVHTSYSNTPDHPKYRLALPLAAPIPAEHFPRAWKWLADVLGCMDPVTHDVSRVYFVPVGRPGFFAAVHDGPLLEGPGAGRTWADLPIPVHRAPLRTPDGAPAPPNWAPTPALYAPATVDAAVRAWRTRLTSEATAAAEVADSRRTAILIAAYHLATYTWLGPHLADELRAAFRAAAQANGRWDDNIETLLEDCVSDATADPSPIEDLVPAADGVAPPILVKYRSAYWVLRVDGRVYDGPVDAKGAIPLIRDRGDLPYHTKSGSPWSIDRLLDSYGTNALTVELVYPDATGWVRRPWDAATKTLRTTRAVRVQVAPVYHEVVQGWLDALLGTGPLADAALRWLATADALDRPTAALYLEGPPGVGKGLLAQALAARWGSPAVPLEVAIGDFPIPLSSCPIVHLDEGTSLDAQGTARFRTLVSEREHVLNEKYLPQIPLVGSPRVIVTANNPDALGIREIHSLSDLDAITERILHVPVHAAARDHLADTTGWVSRADGSPGLVPEHLAWLASEMGAPAAGGRWVVAGVRTEWHDSLIWRVPEYAATLGGVLVGLEGGAFKRVAGGVEVVAKTLHQRWASLVLEDRARPTMQSLLRTLAALGRPATTPGAWVVDERALGAYARALGAAFPSYSADAP